MGKEGERKKKKKGSEEKGMVEISIYMKGKGGKR